MIGYNGCTSPKLKLSDRTKGQGNYRRTKIYIARENHRVCMRDRAVAAKYGSLKLSAVEFFPMDAIHEHTRDTNTGVTKRLF